DVVRALLVGRVLHQRRAEHRDRRADEARADVEVAGLLVEDPLVPRRAAAAAELLRVGQPREAVIEQRPLPGPATLEPPALRVLVAVHGDRPRARLPAR